MAIQFKASQAVLGVNYADTWDPATLAPYFVNGEQKHLPFAVGHEVDLGSVGAKLKLVKASTAFAIGSWVVIDADGTARALSTTTMANRRHFKIGVALGVVTSGHYCWVQISGLCDALLLANAAVGARINTTATAGSADDDATSGAAIIENAAVTTGPGGSAGLGTVYLTDPVVGATI